MAKEKENTEFTNSTANDYIKDLKVSDKNLKLARAIIEQKGSVVKWPNGFDIDLISVVGFRHESQLKKKDEAIHEAATLLASELDSGALDLADNFAEQFNLDLGDGKG